MYVEESFQHRGLIAVQGIEKLPKMQKAEGVETKPADEVLQ